MATTVLSSLARQLTATLPEGDKDKASSRTPPSAHFLDNKLAHENKTYVVVSGDTLSGISKKFFGEVNNDLIKLIAEKNGIKVDSTLRLNQVLQIPPKPVVTPAIADYPFPPSEAQLAKTPTAADIAKVRSLLITSPDPGYKDSQLNKNSHYKDPIVILDRLSGISRRCGHASPEVQTRCITEAIKHLSNCGFSRNDIGFALCLIRAESGFNPDAAANTSASGLLQMIDGRREDLSKLPGLSDIKSKDPFSASLALTYAPYQLRDIFSRAGEGKERDLKFYQHAYCFHHDGLNASNFAAGTIAFTERMISQDNLDNANKVVNEILGPVLLVPRDRNRDLVANFQKLLIQDGRNVGSSGADGALGDNTLKAWREYQKARGILNPSNEISHVTLRRVGLSAESLGISK